MCERSWGIQTLVRIVVLLAVSSLGFLSVATAKNITVAYQTPPLTGNRPIFAANELRMFPAENLEVKTVFIQGGPAATALIGGGTLIRFRR